MGLRGLLRAVCQTTLRRLSPANIDEFVSLVLDKKIDQATVSASSSGSSRTKVRSAPWRKKTGVEDAIAIIGMSDRISKSRNSRSSKKATILLQHVENCLDQDKPRQSSCRIVHRNLKPKEEEIMTLKRGHFFLSSHEGVRKVYVQPTWMSDTDAILIARGVMDIRELVLPESGRSS